MGKATGSRALLQSIEIETLDKGWPLVERQEIIDAFDKEIFSGPLSGDYKCFLLCGNGGMGKSFCCDWYLKNIRSDFTQYMYYDFDLHKEDVTVADILLSWANLIVTNNNKYSFHSFIFTYNQYEKVLGKAEKSLQRKMIQDNVVVNGILEAISMGNGLISSSFKIAEIISRTVKKLLESNNDFYKLVNACEELNVLEQLLVVAFCKDMEDNLQKAEYYPFVFFIDTYEAYVPNKQVYENKDSWVESLISSLPNCIWVIAGREEPTWDSVKFDQYYRLGPITKEDAFKAIFEHAKINDIRLQGIIQKKSAGNPYYIQRLVKECLNSDGDIDETNLEATPVAERILRYVDDETAALAYALSYLESWEDGYLKEYTLSLGLNGIPMSALKKTGIIHDNYMDKHVYICLQEAIEIEILEQMYKFFKDKIGIDDSDYYSRNRYLKALLLLYKNNPTKYEDEVGKNLVRWFDMACEKLFDALEKEFLPFWNSIHEEDSLYVKCLIVYREFLSSTENIKGILETIQPDNEDKIFDFIKRDTRYMNAVLLYYNYVREWDYADRIVNYVNNTIVLQELDETDRFRWFRSLIRYYCGKGELDKAYQLYESINEIVVNESNASEYLTVVYEFLGVLKEVMDYRRHEVEVEKAYRLGQLYLKDGSVLKHFINDEYYVNHNLRDSGEDTSELAWDEYRYSIALYSPSRIEGLVKAKTILLSRLFDNEKFDDIYKIADEVEALYCKYPSRCKESFFTMRGIVPLALLRQRKYEDAIKQSDLNLTYAEELPDEPIKATILLNSGFAYYKVANEIDNHFDCLKKANKSSIKAIQVGKEIWGKEDYQLVKMYYQLAKVKWMLGYTRPAVDMLGKAMEISKKSFGNNFPHKKEMLDQLSVFMQNLN